MKQNFLARIVRETRRRLVEKKAKKPFAEVERLAGVAPAVRDFASALRRPGIGLIAEIKRASPSKGLLNPGLDATSQARLYAGAGARAISVLTEPQFFKGSLDDLKAVRQAVEVPVLRKDFTLDPYQVWEAREYGADAVLLIVTILSEKELRSLFATASSLGMASLVEVHSEKELRAALSVGANIIGINHRNLTDFSMDMDLSARLLPLAPPGTIVVAESGIKGREDVARLEALGVKAVLVGEALVTHPDPAAAIGELLGHAVSPEGKNR